MKVVEYRMIDMEGEALPAPEWDFARLKAREEREIERARLRDERRIEKERAKAKRNLVEIDVDGRRVTITRKLLKRIQLAQREYAKRERQKMLDLGIRSDDNSKPCERTDFTTQKVPGKKRKKGLYFFDY